MTGGTWGRTSIGRLAFVTRVVALLAVGLALSAAAAAIAYAATVGSSSTTAAPPPPGPVRMSPSGDDGSCARGEGRPACRSWRRAYAIAQPGDTITVAGGTYEGGTLTGSKRVTFRVAAGQTVQVSSRLNLTSVENLTLYGPIDTAPAYDKGDFYSLTVDGCSSNVALYGVSGRIFDITDSARNVRLYGGDWGGYKDRPHSSDSTVGGNAQHPAGPSCGDGIVRDVVLDGVRFHDVQFVDESQWDGAHPDCLESHGAFVNLTIRNSRFERCGNTFFGVYTDWGSFSGLLMENNLFSQTTKYTFWGLQVGTKPGFTCSNIVFRYNTYDPNEPDAANRNAPMLIDDCAGSQTQVYGNVIRRGPPGGGCSGSWSYNLFEEGPLCGTNSVVKEAFFFARGTNYHLRPGSPAIGRGDPKRAPARDVDGQPRDRTETPDAGFDEALPILPPASQALLARAGTDLTRAAAVTLALGSACKPGGNEVLQRATERLGASIGADRGRVSTAPCSFLTASAAVGPYRVAERFQALANGVRDARYKDVVELAPRSVLALRGTTSAAKAYTGAFNAEAENSAKLSELLGGVAVSMARATAAGKALNATAQDRQLAATRAYARQARTLLLREVTLRRSLAAALRRTGVGARLSVADADNAARRARGGLSTDDRRALAALGLRAADIRKLDSALRRVPRTALRGASFSTSLTDPTVLMRLRAAAAALQRVSTG